MPAAPSSEEFSLVSQLCVECGLCCDGSLFRFLPVAPEELARFRTLGLPTVLQSGRPAMPLPCSRLSGRCCTIYGERPEGCRSFFCRLSARLASGELTLVLALTAVHEAQARIELLRQHWPGPGPTVQTATAAALAGDRRISEEALEALASVQAWHDHSFLWP